MGRAARRSVTLVGLWAAALGVNRSLRRVRGRSMSPTLAPGDLLVTLPVRRPRRGDVVVLRDPRDREHLQVKRVIGLPGEHVRIRDGRLQIDARTYRESYDSGVGPDGAIDVPERHVVVLGDARAASTDSRAYGPVPLELVERRAVARLLPRPRLLRRPPTTLTSAPGDGLVASA